MERISNCRASHALCFSLLLHGLWYLLAHVQRAPLGVPHELLSLVCIQRPQLISWSDHILFIEGVWRVAEPMALPPSPGLLRCGAEARRGRRRSTSWDLSGESWESKLRILLSTRPWRSSVQHVLHVLELLNFIPKLVIHSMGDFLYPRSFHQQGGQPEQPRSLWSREPHGVYQKRSDFQGPCHFSNVLLIWHHIFGQRHVPHDLFNCDFLHILEDPNHLVKQHWASILQMLLLGGESWQSLTWTTSCCQNSSSLSLLYSLLNLFSRQLSDVTQQLCPRPLPPKQSAAIGVLFHQQQMGRLHSCQPQSLF